MILGIDPGAKGGICVIDEQSGIIAIEPLNSDVVKSLVKSIPVRHCALEHAQAMPKQGVVSMFKYGEGFGVIQGILQALEIPYTLVKPREWQKEMFKGSDAKLKSKQRALTIAKRLWPEQSWLATPRSKVAHDGMVDSALIAEWARRMIR